MESHQPSVNLCTAYVNDIDEFSDLIKIQSLRVTQTGRGQFKGSLTSCTLDRGMILIGTGTNGYISEGAYAPDVITLGMIIEADQPSLVNGTQVVAGNFAIVDGEVDYLHRHAPHTSWLALQIRREDLQALGVNRLPLKYTGLLNHKPSHFPLVRMVHSIAEELNCREMQQPLSFNTETAYRDIATQVAYILTEDARPLCLSRHDYLQTAATVTDYLQAHRSEAIHVCDLCGMTGKNERTLERICQKAFDMPPRTLIKMHRLNAVRVAIKNAAADAKPTITELAMAFGFMHLGRFSADYKKLFGELPSQTLLQAL